MRHVFEPSIYYNTFGCYEPVLRVPEGGAEGATIVTKTLDARGHDQQDQKVAERGNPLTGPFYIEGAEPGDTLEVTIDKAYPNREFGWTRTVVAAHVVDPSYVTQVQSDVDLARWRMDLEAGTGTLIEPQTSLTGTALPLAPMLGCLGVAPSRRQAISSATSAAHGGNMDYRGLMAGTTVYFPVFEPGALLFVGDGHAVQGDGEIIGTGIEISFDVELTVRVHKGKEIGWPRGENDEYIFTMGNARPLDQALQHATTEMMRWLQSDYGMDVMGASILLGQCVVYEVGNVFDPAYTMVCKVPKRWLK
jgi:amidase